MLQSTPNRWLVGPRKETLEDVAPMRLFALPYAGGSASAFRQWHKNLPASVDLYAIQLPGREARFAEPKLTYFFTAIEAIVNALRPMLDRPFALFGHSLGGILAFETARCLRRVNAPMPSQLFISGCSAPQVRGEILPYSKLSDAKFIEAVNKYGGLPDEVLQNSELIELFLPTLRADFGLLETYHYYEEAPLDCPITVFGGDDDPEAPRAKLTAWNIHTTKAFRISMFPGGHFYLNAAQASLTGEIIRDLDHTL